jgi:hypothetical protein
MYIIICHLLHFPNFIGPHFYVLHGHQILPARLYICILSWGRGRESKILPPVKIVKYIKWWKASVKCIASSGSSKQQTFATPHMRREHILCCIKCEESFYNVTAAIKAK